MNEIEDSKKYIQLESEYYSLRMLTKELLEALVECRWRLAANQSPIGVHPNDIKALDMAEAAIEKGCKAIAKS